MKKILLILFVFNYIYPFETTHLVDTSQKTLYNEYTESIANDINYYKLFRKLQAKASNHLRKIDRHIRNYIQDLNFNYKYHQALAYSRDLTRMLKNLEIKFIELFQAADESFLLVGTILDENDNTSNEKKQFITRAKRDLQQAVDKLIKESHARFMNAFN